MPNRGARNASSSSKRQAAAAEEEAAQQQQVSSQANFDFPELNGRYKVLEKVSQIVEAFVHTCVWNQRGKLETKKKKRTFTNHYLDPTHSYDHVISFALALCVDRRRHVLDHLPGTSVARPVAIDCTQTNHQHLQSGSHRQRDSTSSECQRPTVRNLAAGRMSTARSGDTRFSIL
jgi:hypothetical protein